MDFLFRLFFKYPWSDYRHGHLGFGTTHRTVFFLGLGLLCLAAAYLGYRKKTLPESQRWPFPTKRAILISLRALALGLILFALARPVLSVKTLAPKENIVVLLIDDSRSMNIQDEQSHSRLEAVKSFLKQSPFLGDLGDRFRLRLRRFSDDVDHIDALETLTAEGRLTSLSTALGQVLNEFGSDPLAAVVLFTDGADNGSRPFASTLQQYQAKQIPLYVCGLGQKAMHRDVEISPILPVRKALPESIVSTDVTVWSNGYEGRTTDLELRENGRLILTKPIQLLGHEQSQLVPLNFAVHGQGFRQYTISVRALPDEENGENNSFSFLVDLDSSHSRILYLEGTPRWEFKFIHQAIDQDNSLQLVSLLRTSGNKFYRQGIESESTLASGFPTLREELFKYKALLLGSIESSFSPRNSWHRWQISPANARWWIDDAGGNTFIR
ncbi:MAG: vWA domain-containing protein [Terriglobia bacterium]